MRWANVQAWFKREWLPFIQYALAIASAGAAIWTKYTPTWTVAAVLLATATGTIFQDRLQRRRSEIDAERQERRYRETIEHRDASRRAFDEIHQQVAERANRLETERDSIKSSAAMLRRLVDDGVIDMQSLLRRFDSRSALLIYVYAASIGYKKDGPKRTYPAMLEQELGAIRLPPKTSSAFVTTHHRLPAALQDPEQLRAYIEYRLSVMFEAEWAEFRKQIDAGKAEAPWYVDAQEHNWRKQMKATVVVADLALGPSNLVRLNGGMKMDALFEIIAQEVDLRRVTLTQERRKKVREFMLEQTFDLILEDESKKVRDAMVLARTQLDEALGCKSIFSYLAVERVALAAAIESSAGLEDGLKLADTIHEKLTTYEGALRELGVTGLRG